MATHSDCYHYNWGGGEFDRPSYPSVYGARCEHFNTFFSHNGVSVSPSCKGCKGFKRRRKKAKTKT